jgi:hypothetical protein
MNYVTYIFVSNNDFGNAHFIINRCGFGGLEVACWPLVPEFAGSNPAEAFGFFGRKMLNTPSFGGKVKPCPMSCFTACKRIQK